MAIENNDPGKNLNLVALILGIGAIVLDWVPILPIALGIVGLILAIKGSKLTKEAGAPTGMATAALVLSIIGLAFGAIFTLVCWVPSLCLICAANGAVDDLNNWASYLS